MAGLAFAELGHQPLGRPRHPRQLAADLGALGLQRLALQLEAPGAAVEVFLTGAGHGQLLAVGADALLELGEAAAGLGDGRVELVDARGVRRQQLLEGRDLGRQRRQLLVA